MNTQRDQLNPSPIKQRVRQIVALLFAVALAVLVLGYVQMQAMTAVRAYVHGESMWAKSQKDAVMLLRKYIEQPDDSRYAAFNDALKVVLADKQARLELQKANPNRAMAFRALREGGNHPDDIHSMIRFFIWFQDYYPMKPAIMIWAEADKKIEELQQFAERLHGIYRRGEEMPVAELQAKLDRLHAELHNLETAFSAKLSEGARWLERLFLLINLSFLISMLAAVGLIWRNLVLKINRIESDLWVSERRFKGLYNANIIGIIIWNEDGEIKDANDGFLGMLGFSRSDLDQGRLNWRQLTPPEGEEMDGRAMQQVRAQGYCEPFEKEFFHKEGHRVPVYVGGALMNAGGDYGVAFIVDKSKDKTIEDNIRLSATVLEASLDGILICDAHRKVLTANNAYYELTGCREGTLLGEQIELVREPDGHSCQDVEVLLHTQGHWQGDALLKLANGTDLPVRASISTVRDEQERVNHYVAVYTDISVRKALEEELKLLAHYDHLTGLANRSLFYDRLDRAISRAQRHQERFALLFVDLDRFKPVNDQNGHDAGDKLLQQVAQRLRDLSRKTDTIGRIGGDEFVVIMEEVTNGASVTQKVEDIVAGITKPFTLDHHDVEISCSVGIAVYPDHGDSSASLLRSADAAMYHAKKSKDKHYAFYMGLDS